MTEAYSPIDEIRQLVDFLVDGKLTPAGYARIEELILGDQQCLQTYVERLDFHSELVDQADCKTPEESVLQGMQRHVDVVERPKQFTTRQLVVSLISSALIAVLGLGSLNYLARYQPAPVGTVSALSSEVESTRKLELGQIIRRGETLTLKQGQAILQMDGVTLDLIGAVSVRLDQQDRVTLLGGTVVVNVPPSKIGFTVKTADAEIVDLGTEFAVTYHAEKGTDVSVHKGEVRATLIDHLGAPSRVVDVTTLRTVHLNSPRSFLSEIAFRPQIFEELSKSRGVVRLTSGNLRIQSEPPLSLRGGGLPTTNFALLIPERQNVTLKEDLTLLTLHGQKTITAGTVISSYFVHYDPTSASTYAPRGSVSFALPVTALVANAAELRVTDSIFGLPDTIYDPGEFRGLELAEDEVTLSDDGRTVSFYFGIEPPIYLDQLRILVENERPTSTPISQ